MCRENTICSTYNRLRRIYKSFKINAQIGRRKNIISGYLLFNSDANSLVLWSTLGDLSLSKPVIHDSSLERSNLFGLFASESARYTESIWAWARESESSDTLCPSLVEYISTPPR